ncbi:hypothetical protein [Mycolicibacterium sp. XJ1819]
MRTCILAIAGLAFVLSGAPAAAQTVLPERPDVSGVAFTDHPALVDAHPMRAESYSKLGHDDHAVAVHFTTGTPHCYGVHAEVQETPDTVTVELHSGTLPEAVGRACIAIAVVGTLEVPLQAPLGERRVVSVS